MNLDLLNDLNNNLESNSLKSVRETLSKNGFVKWEDDKFPMSEKVETWASPEDIANFHHMITHNIPIQRSGFKIVGYDEVTKDMISVVYNFSSSILPITPF